LPTRDIHVTDPGPFTTQIRAPRPATAALRPSRRGFTLVIEIETDDPSSASDIADSYAAQLAEHLTLWFCDRVKKAVVAKRTDRQFQGADPNTLHAFPGEVVLVGHAMRVRITAVPKVKTLQDALSDFSLRLMAPPPVFAADIVVARQMYFAALKVENRASRFLIIYTALAVFSTFKLGTTGGTQHRIDQVLTAEDPTLTMTTPPGRTRTETEFTKARNGPFARGGAWPYSRLGARDARRAYPSTPVVSGPHPSEGVNPLDIVKKVTHLAFDALEGGQILIRTRVTQPAGPVHLGR